jgi:hypothetical protein
MPLSLPALKINKKDFSVLKKWIRSSTTPSGLARRARIILLAVEGHANRQIGLKVGCRAHVVGQWRRRYQSQGLDGLRDKARPGRPVVITAAEKKEDCHPCLLDSVFAPVPVECVHIGTGSWASCFGCASHSSGARFAPPPLTHV